MASDISFARYGIQIVAGLVGGIISGLMIQIPLLDSTASGLGYTLTASAAILIVAVLVFGLYKLIVDSVDPEFDTVLHACAIIILFLYGIALPASIFLM